MRSSRGQASLDYVAALALVAVLLAIGATAVAAPWLPSSLASAIRRGICLVSGSWCSPAQAQAEGLEPCTIRRRSDAERAGVTALIGVGRSDALMVERRSDGTASVAFVDGGRLGGELGVGIRLAGNGADAKVAAGVVFNQGRLHEFASWPAAQRFLARYAASETMTGEGRRLLRDLCPFCAARVIGDDLAPPEPDARYTEGGGYADLSAEGGVERPAGDRGPSLEATLESRGVAVIGRRRQGARTTYYLRIANTATAELGMLLGSLASATEGESAIELTLERGELVTARVRAAAALAAEVELLGTSLDTGEIVDRLSGALTAPDATDATGGMAVEASVALDLTDPANHAAVKALLITGPSDLLWAMRLRALGRRLDLDGEVDVATFRTSRSGEDHDYTVRGGVSVGVGYGRTTTARELLAAWSGRPAGLRRREDCELAAQASAGTAAR